VSARIALRKPMMPCSKKIFFATISPKNVGGGEGRKNFSGHSKKGRKNFSGHKPIKLRVKTFFSDKFLLNRA
jgi:hypothetical protein